MRFPPIWRVSAKSHAPSSAGLRTLGFVRSRPWRRRLVALLRAERRLDRTLLRSGGALADLWRVGTGTAEFRFVRRGVLVALGLASEAATLGAAALVALVVLAQPAMRETAPGWLKRLDLAVIFLDREGREIGRRGIRHDDRARLEAVPDIVVQAVLATEDRRFFSHWGLDPVGLVRALSANARASGVVQGGSTLTQQLAKNLFLTNERTLDRKIKEAFLALWLEAHYSKTEILQLYLDRAYMGGGAFGIAAASEHYFGKPIAEATLPEAAMLAGLFKAPSRFAPDANPEAAERRAADVLAAMVDAGVASPGEAVVARAAPARAITRDRQDSPDYFLDWAFAEVARRAALPGFADDTVLTVQTGFDPAMQRAAERAVAAALEREGERLAARQASAVVMDPDGTVRAMVGGRDYAESQFNRATDALRQPGSAFKPFVYTAALAAGYRPDTPVLDSEICIGRWCPQNYARSHAGTVPLWSALARSINTVPVKLSIALGRSLVADRVATPRELTPGKLAELGRGRIVDVARRMGIRTALPDAPSLPLGAGEVTLIDMTSAYAVLANGGIKAEPRAALTISNSRGRVLYDAASERRPSVIAADIVADMNLMMSKVVETGTAKKAALPGTRSAGKTGTTNGYRDAWYVGFTGDLVTGVWFGNDDHGPMDGVTGGSLPAATWKAVMSAIPQPREPKAIPGLAPKPEPAAPIQMPELVAARAPSSFAPVRTARRSTFGELRAPASSY